MNEEKVEEKAEETEVEETPERAEKAEGPDKRYTYIFGALDLYSVRSEKALKNRNPKACDPGEHDWEPYTGFDKCSNCEARRQEVVVGL